MNPEVKRGDYVRLNERGQLVKCKPTDFAYGTVVGGPDGEGRVVIARLGTDSRVNIPTERHILRPEIPDLADVEAVEQWLTAP